MDYVINVIKGRWDKIDDLDHMHNLDYITLVVDTTNERVPEILENSIFMNVFVAKMNGLRRYKVDELNEETL